ncbi:MAG TPA: DUF3108 domain-containing protein [Gemmatimonadaceae bacterium]|nr:DUF3108 domain-containing protein [Gemmatimonadaceae bacterium]
MKRGISRLAMVALLLALPLSAQDSTQRVVARVPFGVGERLEFDIRFGKLHVGTGTMEVLPFDTVRGRDAWHTVFLLSGGIPFYHVNDRYEDWFDTHSLSSLRYWQDIDEGNYEPKRHYEIYPERREYIEDDKPPQMSVARPLDEGSFLYFLRTVPLRVGMDTSFNDYFRAERNPVRFKVLRRDTIDVPAGRFNAIVIQPIFESKLFSEGGQAQIWLSDDENHIMLQMKSKVRFGSLNLYLKSYQPSPATSAPLNRVSKP